LKEKTPVVLTLISLAALILFVAVAIIVLFFTPLEAVMGAVQKMFYFHVSAGWVGMLSFLVAAISGGVYLKSREHLWDILSQSSVEIGLVFTLICIISGSIWAKPIWNTWWTWDPRLTTVSIMALIYAAYLLLRRGIDEPEKSARFGAVYTLLGFVSVPLTFISIRLLRTIHPVVFGGSASIAGSFSLEPRMLFALTFSLAAFSVMFAALLWHRTRLGLLEYEKEKL